MRLAKIENDKIVDIAIFEPNDIPSWASDWINGDDLEIGMIYNGIDAFVYPNEMIQTLEDVKNEKKSIINAWRAEKLASKDLYITYQGIVFDADITSQYNLNSIITTLAIGGSLPPDFIYRSRDNTNHALTTVELAALSSLMVELISNIYQISWHLKEQVDKAVSVQEVLDISWPV